MFWSPRYGVNVALRFKCFPKSVGVDLISFILVLSPAEFLGRLGVLSRVPSVSAFLRLCIARLRELARREGVSINQVISSAVGEKLTSLRTLDYLRDRARRGDRRHFEQVLCKVPDVEPEETDRLPKNALKPAALSRPRRRTPARNR